MESHFILCLARIICAIIMQLLYISFAIVTHIHALYLFLQLLLNIIFLILSIIRFPFTHKMVQICFIKVKVIVLFMDFYFLFLIIIIQDVLLKQIHLSFEMIPLMISNLYLDFTSFIQTYLLAFFRCCKSEYVIVQ